MNANGSASGWRRCRRHPPTYPTPSRPRRSPAAARPAGPPLVVCFGALAGCYLVLTAEFVAWVQVLIYIGAIVVLMLFGAMLTRAPIGRQQELDSANRPVAAVAGLATGGVL